MILNNTSDKRKAHYDSLPEDVKAVMALFNDMVLYTNDEGEYFDVADDKTGEYFFLQPIAHISGENGLTNEKNKARFVSWVRAGMPEGYNTYENIWTRDD